MYLKRACRLACAGFEPALKRLARWHPVHRTASVLLTAHQYPQGCRYRRGAPRRGTCWPVRLVYHQCLAVGGSRLGRGHSWRERSGLPRWHLEAVAGHQECCLGRPRKQTRETAVLPLRAAGQWTAVLRLQERACAVARGPGSRGGSAGRWQQRRPLAATLTLMETRSKCVVTRVVCEAGEPAHPAVVVHLLPAV